MAGIGSAVLGALADATSIYTVFAVCSFLPLIGLLCVFLPKEARRLSDQSVLFSSFPLAISLCR